MTDLGQQPTDYPVSTAVQSELNLSLVTELVDYPKVVEGHQAVVEPHTPAELFHHLPAEWTGHEYQIGLSDAERRVRQPVRQLAVVGEQQQPPSLHIESPDMEQPLRPVPHQIPKMWTTTWIAHGGYHARGLVQGKVFLALRRGDPLPIDPDLSPIRVNPSSLSGHESAIHRHSARGDQLLSRPTARDTSLRENLLQTHGRG